MCGIVGFSGPKNESQLDTMLGCITHRGPDDSAKMLSDIGSFGMRRLSIIDLTPNIYPISDPDHNIEVVFNGEIYNYKQLRSELIELGYKFRTESDSEVIVQGYLEWGVDVVQKLRGMFAISLYDARNQEIYLFRDRLGIKPLYYAEFDRDGVSRIVWASEIKSIFAAWDIDRSPDEVSVYRFLMTRVHDDSKRTFFKNVKRLMPGHYMHIDKMGNYRIQKYWQPEINTTFKADKPDSFYIDNLRDKLLESMQLHLISDVPLGVNLSGGLDSSGVVSMAAKLLSEGTDLHTGDELITFSAVHPGEPIDESEYIDEVLRYTGAKSIKVSPSLATFWDEIDEWVYFQEEPTISTAPYAYYVVMREATKHVTVLLSGQGGDELFAGYIPYFMSYVNTARDAKALWQVLRESVQGFDLYAPFVKRKILDKLNRTEVLSVSGMLNTEHLNKFKDEAIEFNHRRNLNSRLFEDITSTTVPSLLRYEDKNSMSHSLESRVPFLDHELVEMALSLPAEMKIKHGWNRYVYREAMKGMMPDKIRNRRSKIGFVNMEWEWMIAKKDRIIEIFESDSFRSRVFWNPDKVTSEFKAWASAQRVGDGLMFWRILSTELWMRTYVDNFTVKNYRK